MTPAPLRDIVSAMRQLCKWASTHHSNDEPNELVLESGLRCIDYYPYTFFCIRNMYGVTLERYLESWDMADSESVTLAAGAGRQGRFLKSKDERFLLKTILRDEFNVFQEFVHHYYAHLRDNPNCLINRIFALHKMTRGGSTEYIVVQENILEGRFLPLEYYEPKLQVYDLKGRTPKRPQANSEVPEDVVLKDKDLDRCFVLPQPILDLFLTQLGADIQLLMDFNLMDYSLLIGIARRRDLGILPATLGVSSPQQQPPVIRPTPHRSIFHQQNGGVASDDQGSEIYFMGLIDTLTDYNYKKFIAHFCKMLIWPKYTLSTIRAPRYAHRINDFLNEVFKPSSSSTSGPYPPQVASVPRLLANSTSINNYSAAASSGNAVATSATKTAPIVNYNPTPITQSPLPPSAQMAQTLMYPPQSQAFNSATPIPPSHIMNYHPVQVASFAQTQPQLQVGGRMAGVQPGSLPSPEVLPVGYDYSGFHSPATGLTPALPTASVGCPGNWLQTCPQLTV